MSAIGSPQLTTGVKMTEAEELHLENLDAARFLGYSFFRRYWYVVLRTFFYKNEMKLARRLKGHWEASLPLTDFDKGFLLSIIKEWHKAGQLSPDMCCMLKSVIQDNEYWRNKKNRLW